MQPSTIPGQMAARTLEECPIYRGLQNKQGVHRDDEVFWRSDGTSFPVEYWSHPMVRQDKTVGAVVTFMREAHISFLAPTS
jgi:hypothetical protein